MPAVRDNFVPLTLDDVLDEELDAEHRGQIREIPIDNGNKITIERQDPYGFWVVSLAKGRLPDFLTGMYTSFDTALRDINIWLKNKKEPIVYGKTTQASKEA